MRHYALYHSHDYFRNRSVWILVSPRPQSRVEKKALDFVMDNRKSPILARSQSWMDELFCVTCMEGWKPYVDFYEGKLEAVVSEHPRKVYGDGQTVTGPAYRRASYPAGTPRATCPTDQATYSSLRVDSFGSYPPSRRRRMHCSNCGICTAIQPPRSAMIARESMP